MKAYDELIQVLKRLPGLGYRSAEKVALHLLLEKPESAEKLERALHAARTTVDRCERCGNLSEQGSLCAICADPRRDSGRICVVEQVPDLAAMERSGSFQGLYHVLHGRLSPINGIGPEQLNLESLFSRLASGAFEEMILALANDIEGEATCHYIRERLPEGPPARLTRIGFGLPSGGNLVFADANTLRTALESRRPFA